LFTVSLIYASLRVPIRLFLSSLKSKKPPIVVFKDEKITRLVKEKAGLNIRTIKISESERPFGMMVGIPGRPQLILSRKLYKTFDPKEIEYVVLHEAAHYKLHHGLIEFLSGGVLFVLGLIILGKISLFLPSLLVSLGMGLGFGILMTQMGRAHEYQADSFTLKKISDPRGMISATKKFQKYPGKKFTQNKSKLLNFCFYRGTPYENRIKMAKMEIRERK
jgi:Zn-dependent protease with chaperone function